jgi:glycosyltransferase involved in cell wall biosynthesis
LNHDINKELNANEKLHILFSGRLIPKAKLRILIQAMKILKNKGYNNYKCTIIGDGDLEYYKELAYKYQVQENVSFTGSIYGKEAHPYFLESDLFVYPGGIGLSILHALSFGLPVITTDNDSLHFPEIELLKKGLNGDVYKDDDAADLADKILIWKDEIFKNRMLYANLCVQSIKEHGYLPDEVGNKVLELMRKI